MNFVLCSMGVCEILWATRLLTQIRNRLKADKTDSLGAVAKVSQSLTTEVSLFCLTLSEPSRSSWSVSHISFALLHSFTCSKKIGGYHKSFQRISVIFLHFLQIQGSGMDFPFIPGSEEPSRLLMSGCSSWDVRSIGYQTPYFLSFFLYQVKNVPCGFSNKHTLQSLVCNVPKITIDLNFLNI